MKKAVFILTVMLSVFLMCAMMSVTVFADENVVYLKDGGLGDGKTDATPLGNLGDAYKALGSKGGTIVVCGSYNFSSTTANAFFIEPKHSGMVTITQVYGEKDYRTDGASMYINKGSRWALNGPVTIENLNLESKKDNLPMLFVAQYNPVIMGEGIETKGFKNTNLGNGTTVMGGYQNDFAEVKSADAKKNKTANITINSGKFIVVGSSRQVPIPAGMYSGDIFITINGGEIFKIYAGCVNDGLSQGKVHLTINGGKIKGDILAHNSSKEYSCHGGSVALVITGGDFTGCKKIIASEGTNSYADISGYDKQAAVEKLLQSFATVYTVAGEAPTPETAPEIVPETTPLTTPETSPETAPESQQEVSEAPVTTQAPEDTNTPATTDDAKTDNNGANSPIVWVIISVVAAAVVCAVSIMVIKKRKAN